MLATLLSIFYPFPVSVFLSYYRFDRNTMQMIMLVKLCGKQPDPSLATILLKTWLDCSERAHFLNILQSSSSRLTQTESQSQSRSNMVMQMPNELNMSQTSWRERPPEPSLSNSMNIFSIEVYLISSWGKYRYLLFFRFWLLNRLLIHLMNATLLSFDRFANLFQSSIIPKLQTPFIIQFPISHPQYPCAPHSAWSAQGHRLREG